MAFCSKCGAQMADQATFCPQCGTPQTRGAGSQAPPNPNPAGAQSGLSENVAGMICYLGGWITGLIFFFIDKRPFVRFHAAQSIVVFAGLHVIRIILGAVFGVSFFFGGWGSWGIGVLLFQLIGLAGLILWILLMIKAYQGERFKIPIASEIAEGLAGKS
jgi:uncharacterized membrane protein